MHAHTCVHTHTHTHAHPHARTHARTHAHTQIHTHTHTHICMHTHTYTRTNTHACTHTHTHTRTHLGKCMHAHSFAYMHALMYVRTNINLQRLKWILLFFVAACRQDQFTCETSGECISNNQKCDRRIDCADGSDERDCREWSLSYLIFIVFSKIIYMLTQCSLEAGKGHFLMTRTNYYVWL